MKCNNNYAAGWLLHLALVPRARAQATVTTSGGKICQGVKTSKFVSSSGRKLHSSLDSDIASTFSCDAEFEAASFPEGHWAYAAQQSQAPWQQLMARSYYYHACHLVTGDSNTARKLSGTEGALRPQHRSLLQAGGATIPADNAKQLQDIASSLINDVNNIYQAQVGEVKKADLCTRAREKLCRISFAGYRKAVDDISDKFGAGASAIGQLPEAAQGAATDLFTQSMDTATDFINQAIRTFADALLKAVDLAVKAGSMGDIAGVVDAAGTAIADFAKSTDDEIAAMY